MEIEHLIKNNVLVITPKGESLDAKEVSNFKETILDLNADTGINKIVFDMHCLQFIDSSGVGSFLSILRTLNHLEGELKLAEITKPIRTMFELVSLHKIFETFNTTDEAVNSFAEKQ